MLKHKKIVTFLFVLLTILVIADYNYSIISWWFYLLIFVVWLGLLSWGSFDIRLGYFVKTYCNNPKVNTKQIALTFDDGPHEKTIEVLEVLRRFNVKATFFCVGSNIEKYPDIISKIISDEHIVGNHTYSHSKSFGFMSAKEVVTEINATSTIIEKILGKKTNYFRPPFGVTNPNIAKAINSTNQRVIGWNIRSLDTVIAEEEKIFNRIKSRVVPGGIVLLHDTSQKTVNVLERLLLFLQSENYEVVTVEDLIKIPAYE